MKYVNSIYETSLTSTEIAVYLFLKDHCNRQSQCYHGLKSIARGLNISVRTVQRAIKELSRTGFLDIQPRYRSNGGRSSNLYTVKEVKYEQANL